MGKKGFRELLVWQKGKSLAVAIYRLTKGLSLNRDFSLGDQMRRAGVSICSNIAEGDERDTDKEAVRFFYIAKGSLAELSSQLEIAFEFAGLTVLKSLTPLFGRPVAGAGKILTTRNLKLETAWQTWRREV
jgi:four helix bundle protein